MPRILLTCMLALLCAAAPAGAKLRDVGTLPGQSLGTDGQRYFATVEEFRRAHVLDLRTGARRVLTASRDCSAAGIGSREAIFNCGYDRADGEPFVTGVAVDLATGEERPLPDLRRDQLTGEHAVYVGAGREWAEIRVSGYHFAFSAFVNRRSGEVRRPSADRRVWLDLDSPALERRLCAPMRRPLVPDAHIGFEPGPLEPAGRWAVAETYRDGGSPSSRLVLQRCGRPQRVLDRCEAGVCSAVVDDDGKLAWARSVPGGMRIRVRPSPHRRSRSFVRPGHWQLFGAGGGLYAVVDWRRLVEVSW